MSIDEMIKYYDTRHTDYDVVENIIFIDTASYDFDEASCEAFHVDEYVNCETLQRYYADKVTDRNFAYLKNKTLYVTFHSEEKETL